jgi:ribosomal protein S18 acetylase RimI-like enzyme
MADQEDLQLKRINEKDIELANELIDLFSREFKVELKAPSVEHVQNLLRRTEFICIVGIIEDTIIAGLTAHVIPSLYQPEPVIYIGDIAVRKKYRGKGLGKALMEKLKPFAKDLAIKEIFVNASGDDDNALKFYRKLGGQEYQLVQFSFE